MCENEKLDESILEPESQIGLVDYLDEFIQALRKQLHSDCLRWGNTWRNRPKEGQELRTKARYTDYFDMFENAGTPVPWMKIVGGALICWIRENHPELCPDVSVAEECEIIVEKHLKESTEDACPCGENSELIGIAVSEKGVEDITVDVKKVEEMCAHPELRMNAGCEVCEIGGCEFDLRAELERAESEKAVEDMTTKELVESEPTVQHKSDCAVHNEPAMPAGECDCQDKAVQHKPGCAVYNDPPAGFASSVSECDCQVGAEVKSNPIAHVVGEKIRHHNGILAYSPSGQQKILFDSVVFRMRRTNSPEVVIGTVDKTGKIIPGSCALGLVGLVSPTGSFAFESVNVNFDKDEITVSYDYEYKLPKD